MKKPLNLIITILVIAGVAYLLYKLYQNGTFGGLKVGLGTPPNQADIDCATGGANLRGNCTRPVYQTPPPSGVGQTCFDLESTNYPLNYCASKLRSGGKQWFLNFESGDRCCYVDNDKFLF